MLYYVLFIRDKKIVKVIKKKKNQQLLKKTEDFDDNLFNKCCIIEDE